MTKRLLSKNVCQTSVKTSLLLDDDGVLVVLCLERKEVQRREVSL